MSATADAIGRLLSKLSGAGPVTRTRSAVHTTNPDSTRHLPAIKQPSTLGQSIGQQGDPITRRRRQLVAVAAVLVLVLVVGAATVWRGQTAGKTALQTAAPVTMPPAASLMPMPQPIPPMPAAAGVPAVVPEPNVATPPYVTSAQEPVANTRPVDPLPAVRLPTRPAGPAVTPRKPTLPGRPPTPLSAVKPAAPPPPKRSKLDQYDL